MAVKTGMFGGRVSFVPLAQASLDGDVVTVPYDKAKIKDAPHAEADGEPRCWPNGAAAADAQAKAKGRMLWRTPEDAEYSRRASIRQKRERAPTCGPRRVERSRNAGGNARSTGP